MMASSFCESKYQQSTIIVEAEIYLPPNCIRMGLGTLGPLHLRILSVPGPMCIVVLENYSTFKIDDETHDLHI